MYKTRRHAHSQAAEVTRKSGGSMRAAHPASIA